jgi:hypothetical protein
MIDVETVADPVTAAPGAIDRAPGDFLADAGAVAATREWTVSETGQRILSTLAAAVAAASTIARAVPRSFDGAADFVAANYAVLFARVGIFSTERETHAISTVPAVLATTEVGLVSGAQSVTANAAIRPAIARTLARSTDPVTAEAAVGLAALRVFVEAANTVAAAATIDRAAHR